MNFTEPEKKGFTIYSKSGCNNCSLVKKLIKESFFLHIEINCDDYILDDKEGFLKFIENKTESSYKTFPIVFYDGKFVGGFTETSYLINKLLLSFENCF